MFKKFEIPVFLKGQLHCKRISCRSFQSCLPLFLKNPALKEQRYYRLCNLFFYFHPTLNTFICSLSKCLQLQGLGQAKPAVLPHNKNWMRHLHPGCASTGSRNGSRGRAQTQVLQHGYCEQVASSLSAVPAYVL